MDIVEEVAGGDEANYYESRHEPDFKALNKILEVVCPVEY